MVIDSVMHKPVVTATADESIATATARMWEAGIGAIVVLDGASERIAGIFTERDALGVLARGLDPGATSVGEVATTEVVTVSSDASPRACAETLRDRGIRHVPVVQDGRAIGILSARDFFGAAVEGFEQYVERARFDEQLRNDVDPYDHMGGGYGR